MDDSVISTSLQIRKSPKKTKSKKNNNKQPIKVVYISNPMKVKTSASEFRALVQKLTGQDAAELPDPTNFTDTEYAVDDGGDDDDVNQRVPDAAENSADDHHAEQQLQQPTDNNQIIAADYDQGVPFDNFDDVFTPLMLENFGILSQGLFI